MNTNWLEFLQTQTHSDPETPLDLTQNNAICDLSSLAIVQIQGADAAKFLQGQLTCSVTDVTHEQSQLGAYCTAKGRMIASFQICVWQDIYLLIMPAEVSESFIKIMQKYALFSKVTINTLNEKYSHFAATGPTITEELAKMSIQAPKTFGAIHTTENYLIFKRHHQVDSFDIIATQETAQKIWQQLASKVTTTHYDNWKQLDIEAGIANVYAASQELFTPHSVNFDKVNGINFKKGCYIGQEVIARMHYLGKLKQHMYRLHVKNNVVLTPGDAIYTDDDAKQIAGHVVDSCLHNKSSINALVTLKDKALEQQCLYDKDGNALQYQLQKLPYAV